MSKREPKTMSVSMRLDLRKYAVIVYHFMKKGVVVRDRSQVVKEIFYNFMNTFEKDAEEQKLEMNTFYAKEFLLKQGLLPRSGQDRSTHNALSHQYLEEEFQTMGAMNFSTEEQKAIDKRAEELMQYDPRVIAAKGEQTASVSVKLHTCVNCNKEYDPGTFDNETLSLWKQTQGQICKDCMDKYSNNE